PFQDGNGRISRLVMAYPFAKAGDLPAFANFPGDLAAARCNAAGVRARSILDGRTHFRHRNGGVTSKGVCYPPEGKPAPNAAPATKPDAAEPAQKLPGRPAEDDSGSGSFKPRSPLG
ncbi:MAG: hypothetical protein OXI87_15930, partial [Albidovulum sp.]|nr:hypothetical protein [Albidovulum sp.]